MASPRSSLRLFSFVDDWVGAPHAKHEATLQTRARLLAAVTLILMAIAAGFGALMLAMRFWDAIWFSPASVLVYGVILLVLRKTRSVALASGILCIHFMAAMFVGALVSGGARTLAFPWNLCVPLLGTYLVGRRFGAFCAVVSSLEVIGLDLVSAFHWFHAPWQRTPEDIYWTVSTVGALLFTAALGALYESAQSGVQSQLRATLDDLGQRKAELDTLIDNTPDIICYIDSSLKTVASNSKYRTVASQLMRSNGGEKILNDGQQITWDARLKHAFQGRSQRFEDTYLIDGELLHLDVALEPVRLPDGRIVGSTMFARDVTEKIEAAKELERLNRQLVAASRQTGMADVATTVIHNVGNVLNSVNVSSGVIQDTLRHSVSSGVLGLAELLSQPDVAGLLAPHDRAKLIPSYVSQLAQGLDRERIIVRDELDGLQRNIEHIKVIVSMQQARAKDTGGVLEPLALAEILEDAITMNGAGFARHRVEVVRQFADSPVAMLDRHKVFQVLMNLLSNAGHAIRDHSAATGRITLRLRRSPNEMAAIDVEDSGCGIAPENMNRIFNLGFTTKKDGHGFGLHGSACAAKEMGGSLTCSSAGVGKGSTFTLEIPIKKLKAAA